MPTADFMQAYYAQTRLRRGQSCEAELALHARLTADPFAAVTDAEFDAIVDRDVVMTRPFLPSGRWRNTRPSRPPTWPWSPGRKSIFRHCS